MQGYIDCHCHISAEDFDSVRKKNSCNVHNTMELSEKFLNECVLCLFRTLMMSLESLKRYLFQSIFSVKSDINIKSSVMFGLIF